MQETFVVSHIRLPRDLRVRLRVLAAQRGTSLRRLAVEAFETLTCSRMRNGGSPRAVVRATMAARLLSLAQGRSAVRPIVADTLAAMLNAPARRRRPRLAGRRRRAREPASFCPPRRRSPTSASCRSCSRVARRSRSVLSRYAEHGVRTDQEHHDG